MKYIMILYNIKKQIIILANCQGEVINYMLNKYYSNYEFILNNVDYPDEILNADIFYIKIIQMMMKNII